jgi:hypothetical protein
MLRKVADASFVKQTLQWAWQRLMEMGAEALRRLRCEQAP